MRHTVPTVLTASTILVAAIVGIPGSAQSQTVIIINGNGYGQPYYPQRPYAYPYPNHDVVYDEPSYYPEYGYAASSYYPSYYTGHYQPYGYGYYRPHGYGYRHWGYRGW